MTPERMKKLARALEKVARKDEHLALTAEQLTALRRQGACELYAVCEDFVAGMNRLLVRAPLELAPPEYTAETFRDNTPNLIQIKAESRIVQMAFEVPRQPISTEKFLIPHILEGEIRAFNQEMLNRVDVRSQLLFYCLEPDSKSWRYFDWRTNHTGVFGHDLLMSLMERLL